MTEKRIYAWISDEEGDGVIAGLLPGVGAMAFVWQEDGASEERLQYMRDTVEKISRGTGKRIRLVECEIVRTLVDLAGVKQ